MRPTAALVIDDVLMTLGTSRNIAGHAILASLMSVYDVVLLTRDSDTERQEAWLYQNGIGGHAALFSIEIGPYRSTTDIVHFANQLRHAYKYAIELFVVGNPSEASALFDAGYTVSLFMHPAYTRPEWRPGVTKGIRPWGEVAAFMAEEAARVAADERTKDS